MPPKASSSSSFEKYFINIMCDFSLVSHFEKLKLPTPQKLHQDNEKIENNNNKNNDQQQQQQQQQSKSYLSALCEDVGMERATVYTVTRGSPYLQSSNMMMNNTMTNSTVQQQNQQQQPFEIICVVISLPLESARQLYRNRNLVKFLKDGMEAIQNKYASQSKNDEDSTMIMKAFLVIEVPRNNNNNNNNLIDHGILSELLIFQSATAGVGVIAGCTFVTVSSTTSTATTTTTNEVTSYLLALGNYLARKAGMVTSGKETQQQQQQQQQDANNNNNNNNNSTIFAPFTSKIRERDDTFTLFEPQFLTRGKIDTADWAAAYRSFLCEIEGITPQKAVSIISKFPSLKSLLDAISRKDQRALAVLADSVGEGGGGNGNNRRMGDALVQKIIDKMTTKFDEKIALSSNARSFILGGEN